MSLSIEIRVNGHPISTLTAQNNGYVKGDVCRYSGIITGQDANGVPYAGVLTNVLHNRSEGMLILATKLLKASGFIDNLSKGND